MFGLKTVLLPWFNFYSSKGFGFMGLKTPKLWKAGHQSFAVKTDSPIKKSPYLLRIN